MCIRHTQFAISIGRRSTTVDYGRFPRHRHSDVVKLSKLSHRSLRKRVDYCITKKKKHRTHARNLSVRKRHIVIIYTYTDRKRQEYLFTIIGNRMGDLNAPAQDACDVVDDYRSTFCVKCKCKTEWQGQTVLRMLRKRTPSMLGRCCRCHDLKSTFVSRSFYDKEMQKR